MQVKFAVPPLLPVATHCCEQARSHEAPVAQVATPRSPQVPVQMAALSHLRTLEAPASTSQKEPSMQVTSAEPAALSTHWLKSLHTISALAPSEPLQSEFCAQCSRLPSPSATETIAAPVVSTWLPAPPVTSHEAALQWTVTSAAPVTLQLDPPLQVVSQAPVQVTTQGPGAEQVQTNGLQTQGPLTQTPLASAEFAASTTRGLSHL